jgi:predicted DNA-binding transcriptional regulator AlpA
MADRPAPLLANYLTPAELAGELGVSKQTLWTWEVRGIGPPATKLGKRVFYARATVLAWMQSREQTNKRASA